LFTGGAWLALHLWDHLTYHYNSEYLIDSFLPLFNGIARFFEGYMFLGPDGFMHTGPTTSPENSYRIKLPGDEVVFSQVAFSTAFDMSILRQCCNSYLIAARWGLLDPQLTADPEMLPTLNDHLTHGTRSVPPSPKLCTQLLHSVSSFRG
jgi:hypothetical protein